MSAPLISPKAQIGANVKLGVGVHIRETAVIGDHCTIGDYCTIQPGANVAGAVTIGESTYVGMGAVILDHHNVGAGAIVAAGAVVVQTRLPDGTLLPDVTLKPFHLEEPIEPWDLEKAIGIPPADGPEQWTGGTLFPQSSRKAARPNDSYASSKPGSATCAADRPSSRRWCARSSRRSPGRPA